MKKIKLLLVSIFFFQLLSSECQDYTNLVFKYYDSIAVQNYKKKLIVFPWIGGLNSIQPCSIDLDLDGHLDLVLFDRLGNKILPFLKKYDGKSFYYVFSPQYIFSFPNIKSWIICKDYDNDGMMDIFTYTTGGIKVYKNVSDKTSLKFKQMTSPYLKSFYNDVYVNILATYVDYPGIADIDGDGDLDILVFSALGSFVEYHHNYSMEKYGIPDSLIFYKESDCWGHFAEGIESNLITLDTCVSGNKSINYVTDEKSILCDRHTGSTFLIFDANGDNKQDLLLGDVDFSSSCILYNRNYSDNDAYISNYSFDFPGKNNIHLFSFPVSSLIDVNDDGINELLVSSFDPDFNKCDGQNSVWLYDNVRNNDNPDFVLSSKSYLQNEMIDVGTGAFPIIFDYNNDGLPDIFIGNYGYCDSCYYLHGNLKCDFSSSISYYQNVGLSNNPEFQLITTDFAGLSKFGYLGLFPSFYDIDNDGDPDLFCGNSSGYILFFENIEGTFILRNEDWLETGSESISYSAPCFYDFNKDGHADLIVGNSSGKVKYFENEDNMFIMKSDSFGDINVRSEDVSWTGYSTPSVFSWHDSTYIAVGSESGKLFIYSDIDNNLDGKFKCNVDNYGIWNQGFRISPSVGFLTGDTYPDIIIGNFSGGVQYFKGIEKHPIGIINYDTDSINLKVYPNPVNNGFVNILLSTNNVRNEIYVLYLYDVVGRMVKSCKINYGENIVDVSTIKSGLYQYILTSEKVLYRGKIIISSNSVR